MAINTTLNIAKQALSVNQAAIAVVSNNISNMNTEGYSKQRVDQTSVVNGYVATTASGRYQIGGGVQIGDITRYRDEYLDTYYRQQSSDYSYYKNLYSMASEIESAMNEFASSDLSGAISDFFTSVDSLNGNPSDETLRTNFIQKANILCTQFNQIGNTLTNSREATVGSVENPDSIYNSKTYTELNSLNSKLEELAKVNDSIIKSTVSGDVPNSLLDQRDSLIDDISTVIPVTVTNTSNNSITLAINGVDLVTGNKANSLDVQLGDTTDPTKIILKDSDGNVVNSDMNSRFTSGSISAYLEMGSGSTTTVSYQSMLDKLDNMASTFAEAFNDIQTYDDGAGTKAMAIDFDANGDKILSDYGGLPDIFSSNDGSATVTAKNLSVNSVISSNPWQVATARVDTTDANYSNKAVGNSENISLMGKVRSTSFAALNNMTPESFLTTTVTQMGSDVEAIEFNAESQSSLYESAGTQRDSKIGVDLNEELLDLVKYQRAFEASSRIFSVASDIMQTIVNLGQ